MYFNTKFPKIQVLCVNFQRIAPFKIALKIFLKKFLRLALPSTAEHGKIRRLKGAENRVTEPLCANRVFLKRFEKTRIISVETTEKTPSALA